jgi:putative acetyltransferase
VIEIRDEQQADIAAIREVNRSAFGHDQEANIVDALRTNGAAVLSLVATLEGRVVGHIMYSPLAVADFSGVALGPMAVLPQYQRQGIGSRLIRTGNQRLLESGCPFVAVVGHAGYYPRFGFTRAIDYGMTCEWDVPAEVFMVLLLDSSKKGLLSGAAKYRPEFSTV